MRKDDGDWQPFRLEPPRYETIWNPPRPRHGMGGFVTIVTLLFASVIALTLVLVLGSCGSDSVRLIPAAQPQKVTPATTTPTPLVTAHPRPLRTPPVVTRHARTVNPTPSLPTASR